MKWCVNGKRRIKGYILWCLLDLLCKPRRFCSVAAHFCSCLLCFREMRKRRRYHETWYYWTVFGARSQRKFPIERKIYLSSSPFFIDSFLTNVCNQKLIYLQSCHPIIFLITTNVRLSLRTLEQHGGRLFNNNLMTLCVWKCICSTWRDILLLQRHTHQVLFGYCCCFCLGC